MTVVRSSLDRLPWTIWTLPPTREQLLDHVWGYDFDPASNVVDVYVGYLRKKLGRDRITALRGMGYRLERGASDS